MLKTPDKFVKNKRKNNLLINNFLLKTKSIGWGNAKRWRNWRERGAFIHLFVSILIFGSVSTAFALSCGDPGSCVIIVDGYRPKPWGGMVNLNEPDNIDKSCSNISSHFVGIYSNLVFYDHYVYKFYWNGSYWIPFGIHEFYTASSFIPGVTLSADVTNNDGNFPWPQIYFPNGCSDVVAPEMNLGQPQCDLPTAIK